MIKEFLTPELLQQYGPALPVSQEEQAEEGREQELETAPSMASTLSMSQLY